MMLEVESSLLAHTVPWSRPRQKQIYTAVGPAGLRAALNFICSLHT